MKHFPTFRALLWLVLACGGVSMTAACGSSEPSEAGSVGLGVDPPEPTAESPLAIKGTFPPDKRASLGSSPALPTEPIECRDTTKPEPCKRHRIPIVGSTDVALRAIYKAAFGSACYVAAANNTFDCFYKIEQVKPDGKACTDAQLIGELSGNQPYGKHPKTCMNVPGTKDWSLQIGPDVANKLTINYQDAPLETSLIDLNGVPTAINGPYRNLPEPSNLKVGGRFDCASGQIGADGRPMSQRKWILEVNKKSHADKQIHSDLAGFTWTCNELGKPECTEETVLIEGSPDRAKAPELHHEVRKKDLRDCKWGTNSNKNAAVISAKLNNYLSNTYPSADEVNRINNVPPYTP